MEDQDKKIIVAIDGYSSCGKSTMAKSLARSVGYVYIDTGAMYRGITLAALRKSILQQDGSYIVKQLEDLVHNSTLEFRLNDNSEPELFLDGISVENQIRSMEVAQYVSYIAAAPCVRQALTFMQQNMGKHKGIVMDGRDIGTTVFPNAELKLFVTADPKVRAERRLTELRQRGDKTTSLEEVLHNVKERDYKDSHRSIAPLRQAEDAIIFDNTYLSLEEQNQKLKALFDQAIKTQQC